MVHDSDGFARWDAADRLMARILLSRLENPDAPVPSVLLRPSAPCFRSTLDHTNPR